MADVSIEDNNKPEKIDEEKAKVEDTDSGDGLDYSSGSDRSLEADDVDMVRSEPAKEQINSTSGLPEMRKKRHGSHGSRRHKGGSRHKNRGFHPYLDPEEEMHLKRKSQELKEKENAAAVVRQEGESHFMNFPIAPFNSTQFLIEQHDSADSPAGMHRTMSSSKLSEDSLVLHSVASTPAENQHEMVSSYERKDKEFTDIYATVHAESLQSLPKDELVKNYMSLEEKVAALQKKVAEAEQLKRQNDVSGEAQGQKVLQIPDSNSESCSVVSSNNVEVNMNSITCNSRSRDGMTTVSEDCLVNRPSISVGDGDLPASVLTSPQTQPSEVHSPDVASR